MKSHTLPPIAVLGGLFFFFSKKSFADSEQKQQPGSPSLYIKQFLPYAKSTDTLYKVPTLFTIAQAGLESDWGESSIAKKANNHFAIKADPKWKGDSYAGYRKYSSPQQSYDDHAKFLTTNDRYFNAFNNPDPYAFAVAVANAGYSENANYGKLITDVMKSVQSMTQ